MSVVDAPLLIADGLRGNSAMKVRIDKPLFKTVSIAHAIYMADVLISVAHFKGHELSGFGGTLKNLGMGCASREGKLSQHSNISPQVKEKACKGCELCLAWCPQEAISMRPPKSEAGGKLKHCFHRFQKMHRLWRMHSDLSYRCHSNPME